MVVETGEGTVVDDDKVEGVVMVEVEEAMMDEVVTDEVEVDEAMTDELVTDEVELVVGTVPMVEEDDELLLVVADEDVDVVATVLVELVLTAVVDVVVGGGGAQGSGTLESSIGAAAGMMLAPGPTVGGFAGLR